MTKSNKIKENDIVFATSIVPTQLTQDRVVPCKHGRIVLWSAFRGGCGKTTGAAEFATFEFMNGFDVQIMNCDPQSDMNKIIALSRKEIEDSAKYHTTQFVSDAFNKPGILTPCYSLDGSYIETEAQRLRRTLNRSKMVVDRIGRVSNLVSAESGSKLTLYTSRDDLADTIQKQQKKSMSPETDNYLWKLKMDKNRELYDITSIDTQTASKSNVIAEFALDGLTSEDIVVIPISDVVSAIDNLGYVERIILDIYGHDRLVGGEIVGNPRIYFMFTDWKADKKSKLNVLQELLTPEMKTLLNTHQAVNSVAAAFQATFPDGTIGAGSEVKRESTHEFLDGFKSIINSESNSNIVLAAFYELHNKMNNPLSQGVAGDWDDVKVSRLQAILEDINRIVGRKGD